MRYLKIKNQGEMEPQALTLMGASSKVDDSSKIGMFGSGNKYAISYLMRQNISLKIYTGKKEIKITTKKETFRGQEFKIIYINDEKTSLTTTMGKDWILWHALREIYCNAIDEGEEKIEIVNSIESVIGETHFYIEANLEVEEFMNNFDNYFSLKKEIIWECEIGKIFQKSSSNVNVYRKGIRCWDHKCPSVYDYDFENIIINESRVVNSDWSVREKVFQLFIRCTNQDVIMSMIRGMTDTLNLESISQSICSLYVDKVSLEFKELIFTLKLAPIEMGGMCTEDEKKTFMFIPNQIYEAIEQFMNESNKAMAFNFKVDGEFFTPVKVTELQQAVLNRAIEFFKECNYKIDYKIEVVSFRRKSILGHAGNNIIYVSDVAIEKGVHDLCNTIIEEQIHLKYDVMDETRAFQTAAINEMLTMMKQAYSFAM